MIVIIQSLAKRAARIGSGFTGVSADPKILL